MQWRSFSRSIAIGGICLMTTLATSAVVAPAHAQAQSVTGFNPFDPQWAALANPYTPFWIQRRSQHGSRNQSTGLHSEVGVRNCGIVCRIRRNLRQFFRASVRFPNVRAAGLVHECGGSRVENVSRRQLQVEPQRCAARRSLCDGEFWRHKHQNEPVGTPWPDEFLCWQRCGRCDSECRPWPSIDAADQRRRQLRLYSSAGIDIQMIGDDFLHWIGGNILIEARSQMKNRTIMQPPRA